jgi:medium-chain acyl-[acyl-carrier-protein] hydrolase
MRRHSFFRPRGGSRRSATPRVSLTKSGEDFSHVQKSILLAASFRGDAMSNSAWLNFPTRRQHATARLFCFAHAGGGASTFRPWRALLSSELELCAIQLPGRAERLHEPATANMSALIAMITNAISTHVDVPFAFFGHSMGAVLASGVAREMDARGLSQPQHLFVAGRRPPRVPDIAPPLSGLPDAQFVAEINRRYGGIPREILQEAEVLALLLPTLRADIAALESYQPATGNSLRCAITALGGTEDAFTPRSHLEAWRCETTGPFKLRLFPGGHFFVEPQRTAVLAEVSAAMDATRQVAPQRGAAE